MVSIKKKSHEWVENQRKAFNNCGLFTLLEQKIQNLYNEIPNIAEITTALHDINLYYGSHLDLHFKDIHIKGSLIDNQLHFQLIVGQNTGIYSLTETRYYLKNY